MARSSPKLALLAVIIGPLLPQTGSAFSFLGGATSAPDRPAEEISGLGHTASDLPVQSEARRSLLASAFGGSVAAVALTAGPEAANAAADCMKDCLKNCNLIAPKDPEYCKQNCRGYCDQDDRKDGLSGSVSSEGGETGILGTYTVVKGEDKPPSIKLPGLDFSNDKGKKLIGY